MIDNKTYAEYIISMMKDNDISMFTALLWDFEAFLYGDATSLYNAKGGSILENTFRKYLTCNGLTQTADKDFYADIFMGRTTNMELRDAEKKT